MFPDNFLTVCVKCNGSIVAESEFKEAEAVFLEDQRRIQREEEEKAGDSKTKTLMIPRAQDGYIPTDMPLFMCTNASCHQIYWYSEGENSSAVRSKALVDKLYKLIQEGRSGEVLIDYEPGKGSVSVPLGSGGVSCERSVASAAYRARLESGADGVVLNCSSNTVAGHTVIPTASNVISHSLRLRSISSQSDFFETISTVRNGFCGLIDHVLYSADHFRCLR